MEYEYYMVRVTIKEFIVFMPNGIFDASKWNKLGIDFYA